MPALKNENSLNGTAATVVDDRVLLEGDSVEMVFTTLVVLGTSLRRVGEGTTWRSLGRHLAVFHSDIEDAITRLVTYGFMRLT